METIRLLVDQHASAEAKIALFRSLFRGREDVYPRRFESRKSGKSGYAPACSNEWVRGICEKPRVKCAECPNRRFLSVNETVIRWHLSGQDDAGQPFVAGVYPMLLDETCFVLAVDFDKQGWADDARVFLETCRRLNVPAALERSRSGRGGHVWIFFEDAIPAAVASNAVIHHSLSDQALNNRYINPAGQFVPAAAEPAAHDNQVRNLPCQFSGDPLKVLLPPDRGRVPPPVCPQLRTGRAEGEGEVRPWAVCHCHPEGWTSPDHLHAVRTCQTSRRCETAALQGARRERSPQSQNLR